jgi:hypothetical protein
LPVLAVDVVVELLVGECARSQQALQARLPEIVSYVKAVDSGDWIRNYHTCHTCRPGSLANSHKLKQWFLLTGQYDTPEFPFLKASGVRWFFKTSMSRKMLTFVREVGKKDLEEPDSQT